MRVSKLVSDTHRHRTRSDRTPYAARTDTERNLIGLRTQSDRTPNAAHDSNLTERCIALNY